MNTTKTITRLMTASMLILAATAVFAMEPPTADQLECINSLELLASWAKLEGPIGHSGSQAGSLFSFWRESSRTPLRRNRRSTS